MRKIAFILAACICAPAFADLKTAKETGVFGEWHVLQSVDKMTDAVECTGIYKNDYNIQLTEKAIYLRVSGGIESIKLRFGNDPANETRLPGEIEKKSRVVLLEDQEFRNAIYSDRLRIQVLTVISGVKEYDINSSGLVDALKHIENGCPLLPDANKKQTSTLLQSAKPSKSDCSEQVEQRMREQKISAAKIKLICEPKI